MTKTRLRGKAWRVWRRGGRENATATAAGEQQVSLRCSRVRRTPSRHGSGSESCRGEIRMFHHVIYLGGMMCGAAPLGRCSPSRRPCIGRCSPSRVAHRRATTRPPGALLPSRGKREEPASHQPNHSNQQSELAGLCVGCRVLWDVGLCETHARGAGWRNRRVAMCSGNGHKWSFF